MAVVSRGRFNMRKIYPNKNAYKVFLLVVAMGNMFSAAVADILAFDFCGAGKCIVAPVADGHATGQGTLCVESRIASRFARADQDWMCQALTWAEIAAYRGDFAGCDRWMCLAAGFLKFHEANVGTLGDGMLVRNRLRLEYSIARIINNGRGAGVRVTPADVKRWLPPVAAPSMAGNRHVVRQEMFRTLLVIGAGLEVWLGRHGSLPDGLRELLADGDMRISESDLEHGGDAVSYRHEDDFWKLRLSSVKSAEEPIRDFMPAVDDVSGLQCPEMRFTSTYSQKRLELFKTGFIESTDIRCRCYLKNGIVHRGTGGRPLEQSRYVIDPESLYYDFDQKVYETRKMNCPTGVQHVVEEAERIFIEIYGDEIVNERPWRVTETADFYLVCGSLPNRNMIGGVAQLKVRKQDGYIWVYFHGE